MNMNLWRRLHEKLRDDYIEAKPDVKDYKVTTGPSVSEKQSEIFHSQATCFVRYLELRTNKDGKDEEQWMCWPFKDRSEAIVKCSELNGKLFEKIATMRAGEDLDIPDRDGVFYLNAFSDPFSYVFNCSDVDDLKKEWSKLSDIDFASLYRRVEEPMCE